MEIILLEKIRNLGNLGDVVRVKPGHGRNYLIPKGKAVPATKSNLAEFESRRLGLEKRAKESFELAQKRAENLENLAIEITALTGDEGKLYGSIGPREIAEAITKKGIEVKKSEVLIPTGAFRYAGEYEVQLQLHTDVTTKVKINILPAQ